MTPGSVAPRTVHSVRPGSTTTWPTCRDVTFSYSTFLVWTYAAPCHPAHFLSNSFQCFLVILQALSLSLCQNHQAFHKNKSHMQRNCNTTSHAAQSLTLISLTLITLVRTPSPMPMVAKIASYNVEYRDISSIQCSVVPCKYLSSHFTGSMLQLHFQAHEIVLQHPDDIQVASANSYIFQ